MSHLHITGVNIAYAAIVAVLLGLKAQGITTDQLADAIARAVHEAGVTRIR